MSEKSETSVHCYIRKYKGVEVVSYEMYDHEITHPDVRPLMCTGRILEKQERLDTTLEAVDRETWLAASMKDFE